VPVEMGIQREGRYFCLCFSKRCGAANELRLYVRSSAEVARPTYAPLDEGYPDWPGLSSTHRGRAMNRHREAFVGIDTAKQRNAVAVAESGREGEIRYLGEFDNTPDGMIKLMRKLTERYETVQFCYDAGPTGYGLYRQIIDFGQTMGAGQWRLPSGSIGPQTGIEASPVWAGMRAACLCEWS